jgi:hypothetical protein
VERDDPRARAHTPRAHGRRDGRCLRPRRDARHGERGRHGQGLGRYVGCGARDVPGAPCGRQPGRGQP